MTALHLAALIAQDAPAAAPGVNTGKLYGTFATVATILFLWRGFVLMRDSTSPEVSFKGFLPILVVVGIVGAWQRGVIAPIAVDIAVQIFTFIGELFQGLLA